MINPRKVFCPPATAARPRKTDCSMLVQQNKAIFCRTSCLVENILLENFFRAQLVAQMRGRKMKPARTESASRPRSPTAKFFALALTCQCFDAGIQARQFPRHRIAMQKALVHAALHFRLCQLEGFRRGLFIAARNGKLDIAHEGADAADTHAVNDSAAFRLTNALNRRLMMRHDVIQYSE